MTRAEFPESSPNSSIPDWTTPAHGGARELLELCAGQLIDASASLNPLGPPPWLRQEVARGVSSLAHYPDPDCAELTHCIAKYHGCSPAEVVIGNGASELLAWLPYAVPHPRWVVPCPSYGEYRRAAGLAGRQLFCPILLRGPHFDLDWQELDQELSRASELSIVALGHPNNPTGTLLDLKALDRLQSKYSHSVFVIDESFGDFVEDFSSAWTKGCTHRVVLRSVTKIAAIPGLRLGYALAEPELAQRLRTRLPPWSVNVLAQRVGVRLFEDRPWVEKAPAGVKALRAALAHQLRSLPGVEVWEPPTNWLLIHLAKATLRGGAELAQLAKAQGVVIRPCPDFAGLGDSWVRVSVRTAKENAKIAEVLGSILRTTPPTPALRVTPSTPRRTASIMLQGCSSDAGKSLLVTALCRCLAQDGYKVAPFKAQNMSNNSGVAQDGGEIGRAQFVQALAAGIEPTSTMNPVLLKPSSDQGAQIVVRGKVLGHRDVQGYIATKRHCFEVALQCFDELAKEYDVIVCEGAGSAGEMNLREADIVNMGFVAQRDMPVLLVGDIDRGGVYASFVGHMEVMDEADRSRVRGFLVNRFRGDPSLLAPAHDWVERHTGKPILGVIPFIPGLRLPGEDRLSMESGPASYGDPQAPLSVVALAGPHVSNATDIDPLTLERDVHLRLVEHPDQVGTPDLIVMLGTKNTQGDLAHFRRIGMIDSVLRAHAQGSCLLGICGGLQMLGTGIDDPDGIETGSLTGPGLGLLPIHTVFGLEKVRKRVRARLVGTDLEVDGYEIHHGTTDLSDCLPWLVDASGTVVGARHRHQRVFGCYLHGLFEADGFRRHFLDNLREHKGLAREIHPHEHWDLNATFDLLAQTLRSHSDLNAVYRLMGLLP